MIIFQDLQFRRGENILFDHVNLVINPKQKIGLVGKNGCGKSTFLSLIKGDLKSEKGDLIVPKNWDIASVSQETPSLEKSAIDYVIDGDFGFRTFEAELKEANEKNDGIKIAKINEKLEIIDAWTIESRAAELLFGLGFSNEQITNSVKSFSGGWRMRLNLAQALIRRSDLLLLDEPTNHLDLDAVIWLEKWLENYPGTLILISHDREFLDPIIDRVFHIENKQLTDFTGNYSSFELQRAMKIMQQNAQFIAQQKKIAHLESYINRFKAKASKAKQAQSRIKVLEKMEKISAVSAENPFTFTFFPSEKLDSPLLKMETISVGYGDKVILSEVSLNLVPNSRIGLLGKNGAGKSTLIKLLAGEISSKSGTILHSKNFKIGYFAQHQLDVLRENESPIWHLKQIANDKETEQNLRNFLGGFDFRGDKVFEPIKYFSGGEKARLVFALIVWQKPNLLLLDEPTNHLDLEMRDALIRALLDFDGAMILVSHDRFLLRALIDEFYLVDEKKVLPFMGDLDDYQSWLNEKNQQNTLKNIANNENYTENSNKNRKNQKQIEAKLREETNPIRKEITKIEQKIKEIQNELTKIEQIFVDSTIYEEKNKQKLIDLNQKQTKFLQELNKIEMIWFELNEKLEKKLSEFLKDE